MNNVKVDIRWIGRHLAGLAWVALRSFLRRLLVLAVGWIVLPSVSYRFCAINTGFTEGSPLPLP